MSIDRRAWKGAFLLMGAVLLCLFFSKPLSLFVFLLLLGHLAFFREPKPRLPKGSQPVSPAYGKVVEISTVFEEKFLKEEAVKIGIFLSIFVPHINGAPSDGTIRYLQYVPGKFLNALKKESVNENESNWIGIGEGPRRVLVRQIAGAIARRIRWDVVMNQPVKRGEKIGIICYGSRVECFLPKRYFRPCVGLGDMVKTGETILGEWLP